MKYTRYIAVSLVVAGLLTTPSQAPAEERKPWDKQDALRALFHDLEPLEPIQAGALTVIPLRARDLPEAPDILGHPTFVKAEVATADPKRPVLRLHNPKARPVLLTAGRVAYTDKADLILAHDVVVPAKSTHLARALPGSFRTGTASAGQALSWYPRWAPPSLREVIVSDATSYDIKTFLTLFHDVVEQKQAGIPTLRDVLSSPFARYLDVEIAQIMHDKRFRADGVIGFVSGIYGRPMAVQLFGSPELHRKNAGALLESHGIYAAAITARADELKIPIHRGAKAKALLVETTRDVLATLRWKTRVDAHLDGITAFRGPGLVGKAAWHHRHPMHLAVYPHDPYRRALFSRMFEAAPAAAEAGPQDEAGSQ